MGKISFLASVLFMANISSLALPANAQEADAVLGSWVTEGGDSCVEIYREKEKFLARITRLKDPAFKAGEVEGMDGKPRTDVHNPNEALRSRSLIGLELMADFQYQGDNKWQKGQIYDPENGKTYKCNMTLKEDGTLEVRGFIGLSLLGRTTVWKRSKNYIAETGKPLGFTCP